MPSLPVIVLAILVMALGSAVQAAVGIGMALVVVPILALIDTQFIPGPMLFAGIALAAATAYRDRVAVDRVTLNLSFVGLGIGTVVGAVALKVISGPYLPKVFGGLILLAVVISIAGSKLSPTPRILLAGSTASGIMGTMVGIHGPAMALVFQNAEPLQARAILGALFTIAYAISVASLAVVGLFGTQEVMLGLALLPGVVIGYLAAPAISQFVDRAVLRVAILTISSISAVSLLFR
jgi:uncharacterized membrane protein YfcA